MQIIHKEFVLYFPYGKNLIMRKYIFRFFATFVYRILNQMIIKTQSKMSKNIFTTEF